MFEISHVCVYKQFAHTPRTFCQIGNGILSRKFGPFDQDGWFQELFAQLYALQIQSKQLKYKRKYRLELSCLVNSILIALERHFCCKTQPILLFTFLCFAFLFFFSLWSTSLVWCPFNFSISFHTLFSIGFKQLHFFS